MDRSTADAYVYARASGMLAKSFIADRSARLFEVRSLHELWDLIFQTEVPLIPETMLAQTLEKNAKKKFISDFMTLLDSYAKPNPLLVELLRFYDYTNIKLIGSALRMGRSEMPEITDIGSYSMLNYEAWPQLDKITAGSSIAWYNTVPTVAEEQLLDFKLDYQYFSELWKYVKKLKASERLPAQKLLQEQIVLENIVWAIRLRVYYEMDAETIAMRLVSEGPVANRYDPLSGPAMQILGKDMHNYAEWEHWIYASLLNPHEDGVVWSIDPRWIQRTSKMRLNKIALSLYHQNPFTVSVLLSWFKIKRHELDCIRTAAEGLRLNVSDNELKTFVGL